MINWKCRIKNKTFWVTLVPAILLLTQQILQTFNININIVSIQGQILDIVNSIFVVLAVLGIIVDPTTKGIDDSCQALTYDKPKED